MPSKSPPVGEFIAAELESLGAQVRARRLQQKVSAALTAEAAGMSRVTLHRIERGEPSVTMGAYLSAIAAVGLHFALIGPPLLGTPVPGLPDRVRLGDFPELKRLAWQRKEVDEITPAEALSLYERNWRHIDQARLGPAERRLVQTLADHLSGGRLLV